MGAYIAVIFVRSVTGPGSKSNPCCKTFVQTWEPKRPYQDHLESINMKISELLLCRFKSEDSEEDILGRTYQTLKRLPQTAPKVDFHYILWTDSPFVAWLEACFMGPRCEVVAGVAPWRSQPR